MAGSWWIGPPGALVKIPAPHVRPGLDAARDRAVVVHDLLDASHARVNVLGRRRAYTLRWNPTLSADDLAVLEQLAELPGPYRIIDPNRRNYLTANQSSGTDALLDTTGWSAPFQGTVTSDTAQARTRSRSLKWDTVTSLTVTNRGVWLPDAGTTPNANWAAVLPSTVYTFSCYARASAAITMYAATDWKTAAGATISTSFGTGTAVGTSDWLTRLSVTATSPATAAYAVPAVLDSVAPSAIRQVWLDDLQLEQAAAATAAVIGTGTPLMSVVAFDPGYRGALFGPTMSLVEVG